MARENQKKRAALRKSLSAKATKISDKGQAIYRTVAKIALKVRPPASTPCSHVHVHVMCMCMCMCMRACALQIHITGEHPQATPPPGVPGTRHPGG